ncbi:hypothetical protein BD310DRAFT_478042 [Dichomitus squalens]|uniref:Uncharacterized protein n=1 Tax=Dichomitus squalens TaxID=114155 RepID=A0A4Q9PVE5_9APHY|nr:hypothetical protein BD310DRAFT_478042 [Dichomitus squalens]
MRTTFEPTPIAFDVDVDIDIPLPLFFVLRRTGLQSHLTPPLISAVVIIVIPSITLVLLIRPLFSQYISVRSDASILGLRYVENM